GVGPQDRPDVVDRDPHLDIGERRGPAPFGVAERERSDRTGLVPGEQGPAGGIGGRGDGPERVGRIVDGGRRTMSGKTMPASTRDPGRCRRTGETGTTGGTGRIGGSRRPGGTGGVGGTGGTRGTGRTGG